MNVCRECICMRESMFYRCLLYWYHLCVFARALLLSLPLHTNVFIQFDLVLATFEKTLFCVCDSELSDKLEQQQTIQSFFFLQISQDIRCDDALTAKSAIDASTCDSKYFHTCSNGFQIIANKTNTLRKETVPLRKLSLIRLNFINAESDLAE